MARLDLTIHRSRVWCLVAIAFTIGCFEAWILFSPDAKVIIWPDSLGYLAPALDAVEHGQLTHANGRGSGYAFVLSRVLNASPEPMAIVRMQRLLVLATLVSVALCMIALARRVTTATPLVWLATPMTLWLMVYALYPPVAGLAYVVMPETLFAFLLAILVSSVVVVTSPTASPRTVCGASAIVVVTSIALVLVKPHALLVATGLPLAIPLLVRSSQRRLAIAGAFGGLVLGFVLMLAPEWRLQAQFDPVASRVFGPRSLFCNSSDLIYDYLSSRPANEFTQSLRESLGDILTPAARARAIDWTLLGFNGDACMYGKPGALVADRFAGAPAEEATFYLRIYLRAFMSRPTYLLARLARHAAAFAIKPFNAVSGDYFFKADPAVMLASESHRSIYTNWYGEDPTKFSGLIEMPTRRWMLALRIYFVIAGVLLIVATAIAAAFSAMGRMSSSVHRTLLTLVSIALLVNGLIVIVHTFEPRYLAMQTPLLAVIGFAACLSLSEQWFRSSSAAVSAAATKPR